MNGTTMHRGKTNEIWFVQIFFAACTYATSTLLRFDKSDLGMIKGTLDDGTNVNDIYRGEGEGFT